MLQKLRTRAQSEEGFTLIELLVVILIIGILAAIALPTFLGQKDKAKDSSAKSDARNAVSQMESCFTDSPASCPNAQSPLPSGVTFGANPTADAYSVTAPSESGTTFTITKAGNAYTRSCSVASKGGCNSSSSW